MLISPFLYIVHIIVVTVTILVAVCQVLAVFFKIIQMVVGSQNSADLLYLCIDDFKKAKWKIRGVSNLTSAFCLTVYDQVPFCTMCGCTALVHISLMNGKL